MIVRHVLTILLDPQTKQQLQLAALQTALHFSPNAIADRFATALHLQQFLDKAAQSCQFVKADT